MENTSRFKSLHIDNIINNDSSGFFYQRNNKRFNSTSNLENSCARIEKNCNHRKINFHQLMIQAQQLCEKNQYQVNKQNNILESLKKQDAEETSSDQDYQLKNFQNKNFKNQIQNSQLKRKIKQDCKFMFNQGFLPQVKTFYKTYKNIDRELDKIRLIRNTIHHSQTQNERLKTLKLAQNVKQSGVLPKKLGIVGRHSTHKINQNNMHLTRSQMRTVSKGISLFDIKKCNLSNNKLEKQTALLFFKNLPDKLQKIELKNSILNKEVLKTLNCDKIKLGQLKKLNLGSNRITDIGLNSIQDVFTSNRNLQILNLSNNLITDRSCLIMGNLINHNHNIRNLNLSWNKLTSKQIHYLFQAITNSISLLNINLSWNFIGDFINTLPTVPFSENGSGNNIQGNQVMTSLEYLCRLIKNNKYLLHIDISNNKIQIAQSKLIAAYFNSFNQTLIGFHFQGNSNFKINPLGYLVPQQKQIDDIRNQAMSNKLQTNVKRSSLAKIQKECFSQDKNMPVRTNRYETTKAPFKRIDSNQASQGQEQGVKRQQRDFFCSSNQNNNHHIKLKCHQLPIDQCWMCNSWVSNEFTFQISKQKMQILQKFQLDYDLKNNTNYKIKNVYIHIECYGFQPFLMSYKKDNRKTLKKLVQQQESLRKNAEAFEELKGNTLLIAKKDIDTTSKLSGSFNTITYCDNLSTKSLKMRDQNQLILHYGINLKVPSNKNISYFFTIDGQVYLDESSSKRSLSFSQQKIVFQTFNPFRYIFQTKVMDFINLNENGSSHLSQNVKNIMKLLPTSMQFTSNPKGNSSKYSLIVKQINTFCLQKEKYSQLQLKKSSLNQYLTFQLYKKLVQGEQITSQQYKLLIDKKVQLKAQEQINSDKYISSQKIIQERQFKRYTEENEDSYLIRPRNKQFIFGCSNFKQVQNIFDFPQFFKKIVDLIQNFLKHKQIEESSQLNKLIQLSLQKLQNIKADTLKNIFYPLKNQLKRKSIYLEQVHLKKQYLEKKIKTNKFTGQILQIGKFDKEMHELSPTNECIDENENDYTNIVQNQFKVRFSKVLPYVLIHYNVLKSSNAEIQQESSQCKSNIFNLLNQRKDKQKQKIKRSKSNKANSNRSSRSSILQKNKKDSYKIIINKPSLADSQRDKVKPVEQKNESYDIKMKQMQNKSIVDDSNIATSRLEINFNECKQDQIMSFLSINLVQKIIGNGSNELNENKCDSKNNSNQHIQFYQNIIKWRTYNKSIDLNSQEKAILKLIWKQIQTEIEKKTQSVKKQKYPSNKKANKFNIKINKFCSLESNNLQSSQFNFLNCQSSAQKRPTFNIGEGCQFFEDQQLTFDNLKRSKIGKKTQKFKQKLNNIDLAKQIQQFLFFDKLFEEKFFQFQLDQSIQTYAKIINKYLVKKQKSQAIAKSLHFTKNNSLKKKQTLESQNSKDIREFKKSAYKNINQNVVKQDQLPGILYQKRQFTIDQNIFNFLKKQRQNAKIYFKNKQKTFSKTYQDGQISTSFNLNENILNRFDFIIINLIKQFDSSKKTIQKLPVEAKQTLLKQIYFYRNFLLNSESAGYFQHIDKLINAQNNQLKEGVQMSLQFSFKVKEFGFFKMLTLLQNYLLYSISLLVKHKCFLQLSQKYQTKSLDKDNDQIFRPAIEAGSKNKDEKKMNMNLNQIIKNPSQEFLAELKTLIKANISDILLKITKLHCKYDQQLQRKQKQRVNKKSRVISINKSSRQLINLKQYSSSIASKQIISQVSKKRRSSSKSGTNNRINTINKQNIQIEENVILIPQEQQIKQNKKEKEIQQKKLKQKKELLNEKKQKSKKKQKNIKLKLNANRPIANNKK